jgi:hypothetical protein
VLRRRYVFQCMEAGVRLRDNDRRSIEVRVHHLMEPPSEKRHEWAPPTLESLYRTANGGAMFCPDGTSLAKLGANYGILFWSAENVMAKSQQFREWVRDDLQHCDLTADELAEAKERISALLSIGSDCGGDAIVLDTSRRDSNGECPVLVLDHEISLAAVLGADDEPRCWSNVLELLIALDQETLPFVTSWRYYDHDGPQYFVSSVEHAS